MKDGISHSLEGAGAGLFWIIAGFTTLVLTAPFFWAGEALSDLRWHVGFLALVPSLPGMVFLPRRRLTFVAIAAAGLFHLLPAMHVFLPPPEQAFDRGDDLTLLEVHWGPGSTDALEAYLAGPANAADVVVITGLDDLGRASIKGNLIQWPHMEAWPPILAAPDGEALPIGEQSTVVLSQHALEDFSVADFGLDSSLLEAKITLEGVPFWLRVAVLPAPGPGPIGEARRGLFDQLEERQWNNRGILICDLASSDTTPSYWRVVAATDYSDARRGLGRQANLPAKLFGANLPVLRNPSEYLFHGEEILVIQRDSQAIGDPERHPVLTKLRIKSLAP